MNSSEQAFVDHMLACTVRLIRNAANFPHGSALASGVVVCDQEPWLVLTAGHIFREPGVWTLETKVHGSSGTLHVALRDVQRLVAVDLGSGSAEEVDLAWARIEPDDIRTGLAASGSSATSTQLPCYKGPLEGEPSADRSYGFAAWNRVWFHHHRRILEAEASYELHMEYQGNGPNGTYQFALARKHQSHAYYQGASGAPIADEEGRIVALVLSGDPGRDVLYGAPLSRYNSLLRLDAASHV